MARSIQTPTGHARPPLHGTAAARLGRGARGASALVAALLAALVVGAFAPATAYADAADDSLALASEGAEHFKAKRFIEAARAFEAAYRTNPVDPRNLRYAGRAWEEVGVVDRAISLFERYLQVETNPEYRQSIVPRLEELRKITPKERAEKLAMATIKYPQGRLEGEAATAFERLGDRASLERAIKLMETSRLWAETPEAKAKVDDEINRLRKKIDDLDKKPEPKDPGVGVGAVGVTKPAPPPPSDGLGTALYVVGGAALVVGGGLGGYGFLSYDGAVKDNEDAKFDTESDFQSAVSSARTMNRAGYVVAGVGVGVLAWAIVRTVMRDDPADSAAPKLPEGGAAPGEDGAKPDGAAPSGDGGTSGASASRHGTYARRLARKTRCAPSALETLTLTPAVGPQGAALTLGMRF